MPRFYFHLKTESALEIDRIGLELADLYAAYLEACRAIPAMAAEALTAGQRPEAYYFRIVSNDGQSQIEVPFTELNRPRLTRRRPSAPPEVRFLQKMEEVQAMAVAAKRNGEEIQAQVNQAWLHLSNLKALMRAVGAGRI